MDKLTKGLSCGFIAAGIASLAAIGISAIVEANERCKTEKITQAYYNNLSDCCLKESIYDTKED